MKPREPGEQGPASLRGRVHNGVQGGSEQPQEKAQTGQKPVLPQQQGHQTQGFPQSPSTHGTGGASVGAVHTPHRGRTGERPPCPRPVLWGQLCLSMVRPRLAGASFALPCAPRGQEMEGQGPGSGWAQEHGGPGFCSCLQLSQGGRGWRSGLRSGGSFRRGRGQA